MKHSFDNRMVGKPQGVQGSPGVEEVEERRHGWPATRGPEEEDDPPGFNDEIRRQLCKIEAETSCEGRREVCAALGARRSRRAHRTVAGLVDEVRVTRRPRKFLFLYSRRVVNDRQIRT